jgi:6,7-dimethyl-8-ribityllumazine synthase
MLAGLLNMLKRVRVKSPRATKGKFAIVASRYNGRYVDAMVRAAQAVLKQAGAEVTVVRVPGAFEVPVIAAEIAGTTVCSGVICLGVIFQGETSHAQHIGWGVTHALAQIQVKTHVPIIHGVFVFEKEEHARVRCLGKKHNRGREAALTALEMAKTMADLRKLR